MNVRVKLYGTLHQHFPGYQHPQGIEVEIPEWATVKDLLALLEISDPKGITVIMEGRVLKMCDTMQCGVPVNVLQIIHGG